MDNIIILGDFNCVLNNRLDIISGNKHPETLLTTLKYALKT